MRGELVAPRVPPLRVLILSRSGSTCFWVCTSVRPYTPNRPSLCWSGPAFHTQKRWGASPAGGLGEGAGERGTGSVAHFVWKRSGGRCLGGLCRGQAGPGLEPPPLELALEEASSGGQGCGRGQGRNWRRSSCSGWPRTQTRAKRWRLGVRALGGPQRGVDAS